MSPKLDRRFLPLILASLVVLGIPACVCQNDQLYEACRQPFECGSLRGIRYPFWGGNRPASCGYPGFEISCPDGVPLLNTSSMVYRVLDIDDAAQTLRVSRNDLSNDLCPTFLFNTTFNSSHFNFYSTANDQNITLYYGCFVNQQLPSLPWPNQFNCTVNGTSSSSFFLTRDASLPEPGIACSSQITVRVNEPAARDLANPAIATPTLLQNSLGSGFTIQWSADINGNCRNCEGSGGSCGYNQDSASFVCHCTNGTSASNCSGSQTGNETKQVRLNDNNVPVNQRLLQEKKHCSMFVNLYTFKHRTENGISLPHFPPMPLSFLSLLIALAATHLRAAYSQPTTNNTTATYPSCDRIFSCGAIVNVTYPFTGGDRPSHCGLPDFALTCRNNTTTELTHGSITYRVLQLDQPRKSLILSRSDLYNNICPSEFRNSTLNATLFSDDGPENEAVTLFYGCNTTAMTVTPHNLFSCNSSDLNSTNAYYLVGPVPHDPILRIIYCSMSIKVPVLSAIGNQLANSRLNLGEALMQGFSVNYSVPYERLCSECIRLGGQCGFDSVLSELICVCGDRPCPFALTLPPEGSPSASGRFEGDNNSGMKIGLPIGGAVLAGVGLGWLIFYCRQRRKRRFQLLATQATQTKTKEISSLPSSEPLSTPPSTNFTKSIPSYPSSNSDLGRGSTYFGVQVFNYAELEEATDNFNPSRELGEGGFGTVYYGVLPDGRIVAVKRLYENNFKRVEQFMNELEILTRLRHQNLVMLYGCTSKRSRELLLVYEYIPNGTVADHLHGKRAKSGLLSWPVRLNIAIETAEALTYLHKSDIIHRDVKTNNILLDNDFHVKVADFGLSRLFPNDVTHVSTAPQGTPGYVDPEYYQCYQLTEKSDVYSFGVVLIELISSLQAVDTNRHRHDINLANMAINKIQNHTLHELVDSSLGFETNSTVRRMATLVSELAFRCLQQERDMRPSMEEVLAALRGIENEDLNAHKVEIVDILVDEDTGPLKDGVAPPSPESVTTEKSGRGSTPNSSGIL